MERVKLTETKIENLRIFNWLEYLRESIKIEKSGIIV